MKRFFITGALVLLIVAWELFRTLSGAASLNEKLLACALVAVVVLMGSLVRFPVTKYIPAPYQARPRSIFAVNFQRYMLALNNCERMEIHTKSGGRWDVRNIVPNGDGSYRFIRLELRNGGILDIDTDTIESVFTKAVRTTREDELIESL